MLLVLPQAMPVHLLFECASALGSVGLSTGITEAQMPAAAKLCLTMLMWLGRLEIISAVMLLTLPIAVLQRPKRQ
jgi:trk system potassium uptake protein TrkH